MDTNPRLQKAMFEVVENQLRGNDPPETRKTLERLVNDGYAQSEAKRMIATVVAVEMFDIMKNEQAFDLDRFVERLQQLPEPPYEE